MAFNTQRRDIKVILTLIYSIPQHPLPQLTCCSFLFLPPTSFLAFYPPLQPSFLSGLLTSFHIHLPSSLYPLLLHLKQASHHPQLPTQESFSSRNPFYLDFNLQQPPMPSLPWPSTAYLSASDCRLFRTRIAFFPTLKPSIHLQGR